MALVEFVNNSSPYINADNLNNNFNELQNNLGVKAYTITQNINVGSSYQNDLLKNASLVVCNWTNDNWNIQTFRLSSVANDYSLNTYDTASCGSIFNGTTGTITAQYSNANMRINKILVIK